MHRSIADRSERLDAKEERPPKADRGLIRYRIGYSQIEDAKECVYQAKGDTDESEERRPPDSEEVMVQIFPKGLVESGGNKLNVANAVDEASLAIE